MTARKPVTLQDMRDLRQKLAEARERRQQADDEYLAWQKKQWEAESRRSKETELINELTNRLEQLGKRFALEGDGEDEYTPKIAGTAL